MSKTPRLVYKSPGDPLGDFVRKVADNIKESAAIEVEINKNGPGVKEFIRDNPNRGKQGLVEAVLMDALTTELAKSLTSWADAKKKEKQIRREIVQAMNTFFVGMRSSLTEKTNLAVDSFLEFQRRKKKNERDLERH